MRIKLATAFKGYTYKTDGIELEFTNIDKSRCLNIARLTNDYYICIYFGLDDKFHVCICEHTELMKLVQKYTMHVVVGGTLIGQRNKLELQKIFDFHLDNLHITIV